MASLVNTNNDEFRKREKNVTIKQRARIVRDIFLKINYNSLIKIPV